MLQKLIFLFFFQFSLSIVIIFLSKKFKLLDYPTDRKTHNIPTPFTGGVIISLSFIFISFFLFNDAEELNDIIFYSFWIAIFILIDDKFNLNPLYKFIIQLFCVLILINKKIFLTNIGFYDLFGLISLGKYNLVFSTLCILLLINATNYNDGIDGLAASISIIIFANYILIIFLFADNGVSLIKYFIFFIFSIFIFLIFNFGLIKKFKLFLGDSGSNYLGLVIGALTIILSSKFAIHPTLLIWSLGYTIYEFLITNINRITRLQNIFKAGTDHLHYYLINKYNLTHNLTLIIIVLINIFLSACGILFYVTVGESYSLILFTLFFIIYSFLRQRIIK